MIVQVVAVIVSYFTMMYGVAQSLLRIPEVTSAAHPEDISIRLFSEIIFNITDALLVCVVCDRDNHSRTASHVVGVYDVITNSKQADLPGRQTRESSGKNSILIEEATPLSLDPETGFMVAEFELPSNIKPNSVWTVYIAEHTTAAPGTGISGRTGDPGVLREEQKLYKLLMPPNAEPGATILIPMNEPARVLDGKIHPDDEGDEATGRPRKFLKSANVPGVDPFGESFLRGEWFIANPGLLSTPGRALDYYERLWCPFDANGNSTAPGAAISVPLVVTTAAVAAPVVVAMAREDPIKDSSKEAVDPAPVEDPAQAWLAAVRLGQYYEALGFDFDEGLKVEDFDAMDDAALKEAGMKKLEIVRFRKKLAE